MKVQSALPLTLLLAAALAGSCGEYENDFDGPEHHGGFGRGPGRNPGNRPPPSGSDCEDAGTTPVPVADSGVVIDPIQDAGIVEAPDAGEPAPADAGEVSPPDAGEVVADAGTEPPPADAGSTGPCRRDNDCPSDQVCNHATGVCEAPPVWCTDIVVEAECVARTDCQAIYGGMNCTDANGGECVSGDVDCTCEIFSFAACINRPQ